MLYIFNNFKAKHSSLISAVHHISLLSPVSIQPLFKPQTAQQFKVLTVEVLSVWTYILPLSCFSVALNLYLREYYHQIKLLQY